MHLIESALKLGRPVLGVCLGSQLLAAVVGAGVKKGERKELGWHAVTLTETAAQDALFTGVSTEFWPFHWHGDVFFAAPAGSGAGFVAADSAPGVPLRQKTLTEYCFISK